MRNKLSIMSVVVISLMALSMCTKQEVVQPVADDIMFLLDKERMEQIVILMPRILEKASEFQQYALIQKFTDDEYNSKFYQYLFDEKPFAERLKKAGFNSPQEYQMFYDTMIEIYLLLLKQPETVDTALFSVSQLENDIDSTKIRQAQEPNNEVLTLRLKRLEYELTSYKNIIIVSEFLEKLNQLNQ